MSKRLFAKLLVLIPALSLILLGMRTPSLAHNGAPKPRPRAVLEEDVFKSKSSIESPSKLQLDTDLFVVAGVLATPAAIDTTFVSLDTSTVSAPVPSSQDSRASPFLCRIS